MGKRGRPPRPETLAWLAGDRRGIYKLSPDAPLSEPTCPDYLDDVAKAEWIIICNALRDMGLLSRIDETAIAIYCETFSRYRDALEQVRKFGTVIIVGKSKYPTPSPYHSVMRAALADLKWFLGQFGLTPSARANMSIDTRNNDAEQGEKWLGLTG